jgi:hypothetical protein
LENAKNRLNAGGDSRCEPDLATFTAPLYLCKKRPTEIAYGDESVKPEEIKKLDAYFKRTLNPQIVVKARPRKNDSAEVYLGEEFLGVVYIDDEDGDRSYNFSMAILDVDL